jgi:hypothetical protein
MTADSNHKTTDETANASIVDPFDPAAFAVSPQALSALQGDMGVVPQLTGISVRKPDKQAFFRAHPDPAYSVVVPLLELKEERETYLVTPAVAMTLPGDVGMRQLTLCQTRQGALFLWPVTVPPPPGTKGAQRSEWHDSARQVLATAHRHWVRMTADMSAGRYNVAIANGITAEPIWPEQSMRDLLELAFGTERLINEQGHHLVKRLLGHE